MKNFSRNTLYSFHTETFVSLHLSLPLSLPYHLTTNLIFLDGLSTARVDRMKEAKSEAEQIISAYRAEMEAMYQKSLATVSGLIVYYIFLWYLFIDHKVFHIKIYCIFESEIVFVCTFLERTLISICVIVLYPILFLYVWLFACLFVSWSMNSKLAQAVLPVTNSRWPLTPILCTWGNWTLWYTIYAYILCLLFVISFSLQIVINRKVSSFLFFLIN